jgi:hypothetical protein
VPLSRIEVCRKRKPAEIQHMLQSVYAAQIEAFKVPDTDRQLRYFELQHEHFFIPPDRTENFTLVVVELFPGRTADAKRAFYKSIVARFGEIGISPSDVFISLVESGRENWSLADGIAACDL